MTTLSNEGDPKIPDSPRNIGDQPPAIQEERPFSLDEMKKLGQKIDALWNGFRRLSTPKKVLAGVVALAVLAVILLCASLPYQVMVALNPTKVPTPTATANVPAEQHGLAMPTGESPGGALALEPTTGAAAQTQECMENGFAVPCPAGQPSDQNAPQAPATQEPSGNQQYAWFDDQKNLHLVYPPDAVAIKGGSSFLGDYYNFPGTEFYHLLGKQDGPKGYPIELEIPVNHGGQFACLWTKFIDPDRTRPQAPYEVTITKDDLALCGVK